MRSLWAEFLCILAVTRDVTQQVAETRRRAPLPAVADTGPCVPPTDSSTRVGVNGYSRFHANDSLIGRPVPCTRDDKLCFRYNLLFDPQLGWCEPIGGNHYGGCDLRPNRTEFEHGSGRLIGVCKTYEDPCPGYRMAYDGRCYQKKHVRDIICGCDAQPVRHFLDGAECRKCQAEPINIQQPLEESHCLIPDLRFPDIQRSKFFENSLGAIQGFRGDRTGISMRGPIPRLRCETQQAHCFANGSVWVSEFQGCHDLLEKGPCPDDHVVAMDSQAVFQGRAETTCVHVRGGCPRGQKRMIFDGKCHDDREMHVSAPGDVVWNQYGQYVLIPRGFDVNFIPKKLEMDLCVIYITAVGGGIGSRAFRVPKPRCDGNNEDLCHLYDIEAAPPKQEKEDYVKFKDCK